MQETLVRFLDQEDPWRRERLLAPAFWPREFHGLYSPQRHKEPDTTERLSLTHRQKYHCQSLGKGRATQYVTIKARTGRTSNTIPMSSNPNAGDTRDPGLIPGWGWSPGDGIQYSCLGKAHRQRSLVDYSPKDQEVLDMTGHNNIPKITQKNLAFQLKKY